MSQVVKPDLAHAGALQHGLEALRDLRAIERSPESTATVHSSSLVYLRVPEDEILLPLEFRGSEQELELPSHSVGERDGP